jgi:thiol-disulfide isomerase/thioredoxin
MVSMKTFCTSVLVPLSTIVATVLLFGCEPSRPMPVAPMPVPDQHSARPDRRPDQCSRPKIIAFGADWCTVCIAGHAKLDELERMGVEVERVNIDEHPDLAAQNHITSIPVYLVIRCGHPTVRTQSIDEAVRLMNEVFGR